MCVDKTFTDKLIKRLYQVEPNESLCLEVYRSELEHIIRQSRIDTLDGITKKWLNQDFAENGAEDIMEYIDTEQEKLK